MRGVILAFLLKKVLGGVIISGLVTIFAYLNIDDLPVDIPLMQDLEVTTHREYKKSTTIRALNSIPDLYVFSVANVGKVPIDFWVNATGRGGEAIELYAVHNRKIYSTSHSELDVEHSLKRVYSNKLKLSFLQLKPGLETVMEFYIPDRKVSNSSHVEFLIGHDLPSLRKRVDVSPHSLLVERLFYLFCLGIIPFSTFWYLATHIFQKLLGL